jgi:hypothetical protein
MALPGFANLDLLPHLTDFIGRRSVLAIENAAPLGAREL